MQNDNNIYLKSNITTIATDERKKRKEKLNLNVNSNSIQNELYSVRNNTSLNSNLYSKKTTNDWRDNNNEQFHMGRFFANKKNLSSVNSNICNERKVNYYENNLFDYIIEWPDHCEFRKHKKIKEEKRIFQCTYGGCCKSYISFNGLKYHLNKKHGASI